jgi:hypothetical protein
MALATSIIAACTDNSLSCDEGQVRSPDGGCAVAAPPYCQPCSGAIASELPAGDCLAQACIRTAYALCEDSCWSACSCTVPEGYTLVDAGFFAPEAGDAAEEAPPLDAHEEP